MDLSDPGQIISGNSNRKRVALPGSVSVGFLGTGDVHQKHDVGARGGGGGAEGGDKDDEPPEPPQRHQDAGGDLREEQLQPLHRVDGRWAPSELQRCCSVRA